MGGSKITKPNGYWLYMNTLMLKQNYEGPFKPFAEANDQLWKDMLQEKKNEWKARAKNLKKTFVYKKAYLPAETTLKKSTTVDRELMLYVRVAAIRCMCLDFEHDC